jgi:hypothetical protein
MKDNGNIKFKNKVCIYFKDKNLSEQACNIIRDNCSDFTQSYYKTLGFNIAEHISKNNPNTLSMVYLINPEIKNELKMMYLKGSHLTITDDSSLMDEMPKESLIMLDKNKSNSELENELLNFI